MTLFASDRQKALTEHDRRHRKKRRRQRLCAGRAVRSQIKRLRARIVTGVAETTDSFIYLEMNVVLVDDRLHRLPIPLRRTDRAAT